jgi:hypothetical protein
MAAPSGHAFENDVPHPHIRPCNFELGAAKPIASTSNPADAKQARAVRRSLTLAETGEDQSPRLAAKTN